MNNAARIYMQNLLSDRVKYLAGLMLNCSPDDTAGLLALASEARDAANALHELNQPEAAAQPPAAEVRVMSDVFKAVARNVQEMRQVRAIHSAEPISDTSESIRAVITDILTAFNAEREAKYQDRVAAASGGAGPSKDQLDKSLAQLGAELSARGTTAEQLQQQGNGRRARH